jgi:hypothetical protein
MTNEYEPRAWRQSESTSRGDRGGASSRQTTEAERAAGNQRGQEVEQARRQAGPRAWRREGAAGGGHEERRRLD